MQQFPIDDRIMKRSEEIRKSTEAQGAVITSSEFDFLLMETIRQVRAQGMEDEQIPELLKAYIEGYVKHGRGGEIKR